MTMTAPFLWAGINAILFFRLLSAVTMPMAVLHRTAKELQLIETITNKAGTLSCVATFIVSVCFSSDIILVNTQIVF